MTRLESGYNYNIPPNPNHPFWATGTDVEDITATASVEETTGTPAVEVTKTTDESTVNFDFAFFGLKGEAGKDGEAGPQGPQGEKGETGPQGPDYNAVTSSTLTNENGIYTIKNQMHDGTETEVGTIEVPTIDTSNVIAEVIDSVVENEPDNYDFHTIKETEYNGTQNEVGKFYILREQSTVINSLFPVEIKGVDQNGNLLEKTIGSSFNVDLGSAFGLSLDATENTSIIEFSVTVKNNETGAEDSGWGTASITWSHRYIDTSGAYHRDGFGIMTTVFAASDDFTATLIMVVMRYNPADNTVNIGVYPIENTYCSYYIKSLNKI